MLIRLYLDEDSMSHSLVEALVSEGVDVLTAIEAGLIQSPDLEQLQFAASQTRVIYSFNIQDFYQLHTEFLNNGFSHAGIVLCRQRQFSIGEQMRRITKLIATVSAEAMTDRVEFLSAWG